MTGDLYDRWRDDYSDFLLFTFFLVRTLVVQLNT